MKKTIYSLSVALLVSSLFITGCDSPSQNISDAKDDVATAQAALTKAKDDSIAAHQATIDAYKKQIKENNELLAAYKIKIANQNKTVRDEYQADIDKLQEKNESLETMVDRNEVTAVESWDIFKLTFNKTRDELNEEMTEFNNKMVALSKIK